MKKVFTAQYFINNDTSVWRGEFTFDRTSFKFITKPLRKSTRIILRTPYFVHALPAEVHFHGIGDIDFSEDMRSLDINYIQKLLAEEGVFGIPTIFLERSQIDDFVDMMNKFVLLKKDGKVKNILGFALEGPILLSRGGTPMRAIWKPTDEEWQKIISCGQKGLKYMVISPDWEIQKLLSISQQLLSNGIRLSLGHPNGKNISQAVEGIYAVTELAKKMGFARGSGAVTVDHLFNDMPQNIVHAWRNISERRARSRELIDMNIDTWNLNSLPEQIGAIPAAFIRLAKRGLLTLFLNFDGHHVDMQICRRVYELVGADNIASMTDRMETNKFGGVFLEKKEIGSLWYQKSGVVAVGTSTLDEQMHNMRALKIPERDIWKMCSFNILNMFPESKKALSNRISYVDKRHIRVELRTKDGPLDY